MRNPVLVPMTDPDSKETYNAVVDGDTFMSGLIPDVIRIQPDPCSTSHDL